MTHEENATIEDLTARLSDSERANVSLRLTNEGLVAMHDRALATVVETRREVELEHAAAVSARAALEAERRETAIAVSDLETLRHERAVALAEVVTWTRRAHELGDEAAELRLQLARAREEAGEYRSDLLATENRLDRLIDQRAEEVRILEEKLHDETITRIAIGRAWRDAVNEIASVLAETAAAAASTDRGEK